MSDESFYDALDQLLRDFAQTHCERTVTTRSVLDAREKILDLVHARDYLPPHPRDLRNAVDIGAAPEGQSGQLLGLSPKLVVGLLRVVMRENMRDELNAEVPRLTQIEEGLDEILGCWVRDNVEISLGGP